MTRDYKNRKPAKRRSRGRRKEAPKSKFKLGLFAVVTVALVAWGIHFLNSISGSAEEAKAVVNKPKATVQAKVAEKPLPKPPKEIYEYVDTLKQKEVEIELQQQSDSKTPYIMQCGSFRNQDDAEVMKASIAWQVGQHSTVERTEGQNGVWYRVRLGPFTGDPENQLTPKRQAQGLQKQLRKLKIANCQFWPSKA
ncbi:SPOR domain-containing protein [Paraferrimonas sp. SM1919]|uniref:SPOR domain-containing protein n=1 Tax=Paraferrimonas sp. SM1919 TaxID=2662263 RepID=UPI0013D48F17|nr:SPOR domain-containing protein [Paraferrimonas sp. SM1919]